MLDSLTALRITEGGQSGEGVEGAVSGHSLHTSVDQEQERGGTSEFINATEPTNDPRMAEVEAKLRYRVQMILY